MLNRAFVARIYCACLIAVGLFAAPWALAQEAAKAGPTAVAPTPALIRQGQDLFLGVRRFEAGGPACNSCHNVVNDAVIGGGTLAADLTESFGRFGADGIVETLPRKGSQSPFPVMQVAFQGRDITAEEGQALAAFLQDVYVRRASQKPNDLGGRMLFAGVTGVSFLLLLFYLIGRRRKRRSVN